MLSALLCTLHGDVCRGFQHPPYQNPDGRICCTGLGPHPSLSPPCISKDNACKKPVFWPCFKLSAGTQEATASKRSLCTPTRCVIPTDPQTSHPGLVLLQSSLSMSLIGTDARGPPPSGPTQPFSCKSPISTPKRCVHGGAFQAGILGAHRPHLTRLTCPTCVHKASPPSLPDKDSPHRSGLCAAS